MHKSLAGTKMQTVGMFETSRLATMSDFTRQLALHFELATDAKIGLSMMHKGTPVTSMNVLTNEMSLAMRVLDGAGDDSGGCGSDSDDLPNDTCFKRYVQLWYQARFWYHARERERERERPSTCLDIPCHLCIRSPR